MTVRRALTGLILGALTVLTSPAWSQSMEEIRERGVLRVAVYKDFPPYSYREGARYRGTDVDLARAIAERMGLPMQYIRKKPKGFGRDAQIEGSMPEGSRVILVEDLTTDGGSKIKFAGAIRNAGATIDHTFAVFYYDIFKDAPDRLKQHGMTLHYLATWWDVLALSRKKGYFDDRTHADVEAFLNAPLEWSARNGGISELPEKP